MYKMMTAREVIDLLYDMEKPQLDFTFDDIDTYPEVEPSGWYGIRIIYIFDEWEGFLAIGCWGGDNTEIWNIESLVDFPYFKEDIRKACTKKLQDFMNTYCGSSKNYEKICVEIN